MVECERLGRKIRNLIGAFFLLLLSQNANAVELRELGIRYRYQADYGFTPELGEEFRAKENIVLVMNVDVLGPFFWDNAIRAMTDVGGAYRLIGWNFFLGLRVSKYVKLGYEHFSQHRIGAEELRPHFPLYDGFFVSWTIFRSTSPERFVFE
ncbi:MAG TPA: hypothetical protein VMZ26_13405 [Pyrinomonadaceae bacterium]|nr:hypothetical protein [Pyrinomonadaceae bacterium]